MICVFQVSTINRVRYGRHYPFFFFFFPKFYIYGKCVKFRPFAIFAIFTIKCLGPGQKPRYGGET